MRFKNGLIKSCVVSFWMASAVFVIFPGSQVLAEDTVREESSEQQPQGFSVEQGEKSSQAQENLIEHKNQSNELADESSKTIEESKTETSENNSDKSENRQNRVSGKKLERKINRAEKVLSRLEKKLEYSKTQLEKSNEEGDSKKSELIQRWICNLEAKKIRIEKWLDEVRGEDDEEPTPTPDPKPTPDPTPSPDPEPTPDPTTTAVLAFVDKLRAAGQVSHYNLLFGTNIPDNGSIDSATSGKIAELICDPNFKEAFLLQTLSKAALLYSSLQADGGARSDFNLMLAANVQSSGPSGAPSVQSVFDVAGGTSYNQEQFLSALQKAASLYRALQNDAAKRAAFKERTGLDLPASGPFTPNVRLGSGNYLSAILGITGDPSYNEKTLLDSLVPANTAVTDFVEVLRAQGQVDNYNSLFGVTLPTNGALDDATTAQVANLLNRTPNFNQEAFLRSLEKTAGLYQALQANPTLLAAFNRRYATNLPPSGPLPDVAAPGGSSLLAYLFALTDELTYKEQVFLGSLLTPADSNVNPAVLAFVDTLKFQDQLDNFSKLFGVTIPRAGNVDTVTGGKIADLILDSSFRQTTFLKTLPKTASLYAALQSNAGLAGRFNSRYGSNVQVFGFLDELSLKKLLVLSGDPSFNLNTFLAGL